MGSRQQDPKQGLHACRSISSPERRKMIASAAARILLDHAACRPRMASPAPTLRSIMPLKIMPSALGKCSCRIWRAV